MTKIEFKSLIDKHFTSKMLKNGWHGTYNNLRKTDVKHLVKTFGLTKFINQDVFLTTLGFDFDIYNKNFKKKIISLNNSNCLFTNTLTPLGVTDNAYTWELNKDDDYNIQLIESLWLAMINHGEVFYKTFENFPSPFDTIAPSEFEYDRKVKLLDKYEVGNQVGFMHLLKDVNIMIGKQDVAKQFSEIAISRLQKSINSQSKPIAKNVEKSIISWIKALEI